MNLRDFAGNSLIKDELARAFSDDTLPHAIIIEGERGTGRRTLAGIIAEYCVCRSNLDKPCGICSGCKKAQLKSHPDIFVADGTNSAEINVDAIRSIRSSAFILPNEAPKKVYILANCDRMNPAAQNAFLKILEEPPKNVIFIMTCLSASSLLNTVRSRSRIFSLLPPSLNEATRIVSAQNNSLNTDDVYSAAALLGGNIGRMKELLDSGGTEAMHLADDIAKSLTETKEYNTLVLTYRLCVDKKAALTVIDCIEEIICEALKISTGVFTGSSVANELAGKLTQSQLLRLADTLALAKQKIRQNANMNLFSAWFCRALWQK